MPTAPSRRDLPQIDARLIHSGRASVPERVKPQRVRSDAEWPYWVAALCWLLIVGPVVGLLGLALVGLVLDSVERHA
jgi:hypothetical protein